MQVLAFGHYGAPLVAFPPRGGQFFDFEANGMIAAVTPLIEAGKLKVYCPESLDLESWLSHGDPHERALQHGAYEDFVVQTLLGAVCADCGDGSLTVASPAVRLGRFTRQTLPSNTRTFFRMRSALADVTT